MRKTPRPQRRALGKRRRRATSNRGRCNVGKTALVQQSAYADGRRDGYNTGFREGNEQAGIVAAGLREKLAEATLRIDMLELLVAGLHPAATALASLARGQGD